VERGLLELDVPISGILPEFSAPNILGGFDGETGRPILRKATKPITLRQLLTHTSGFAYVGMNQALTLYSAQVYGEPPSFKLDSPKYGFELPLVFEPGESWEYGVSLEWVGRMVERANGGRMLGEFMRDNIFDVLGMDLTTFRPWGQPKVLERMGGRTWRDPESGKIAEDNSGWFPFVEPEEDYGGGGAYTCARDYVKVLMSLLHNDGRLLKPKTVELFFSPQLEDPTALCRELSTGPIAIGATNGLPRDRLFNYGLGGALCMESIPGHCGRGMMFWSGLPNSFWVRFATSGLIPCTGLLLTSIHTSYSLSTEKQGSVGCTSHTCFPPEMSLPKR
jgi:CubicO group peptidase (beta-lactamase class C family)